MKNRFSNIFQCLALPLVIFTLNIEAESVRLPGHIPQKAISNATLLNRLEETSHVRTTFILPLRNQDELEELVNRIYDPTDQEHYGKYLTAEEFVERFAPTQKDYSRVIAHARSLGLMIRGLHPNRTLLNVSGPAHIVESAFNVQLHEYAHPSGRVFYAPDNNPEVPSELASVISGVVGLDNHARWRPYRHQKVAMEANATPKAFPSGPGGGFGPSDLIQAYNLSNVSTNGSGQVIALFELASYATSDITTYTNYFGLPAAKLKNILVSGGSQAGNDAEVTLDIQLALALAPESEIYVYEGPNSNQGVLDTYNRIATDNVAKQISTSWGSGEDTATTQYLQAESAIFQQMAAQGQTIYAAAGDSGAYDDYAENSSETLIVDDPASQPYVVGVGGTSLLVNGETGTYEGESVWNDGLGNGAGGGGVSAVWPIPSWQAGVTTVSSKTNRNVPDVTLNADTNTGYAIYFGGQWQIYGGTSCAAPLWAAFTACVNQALAEAEKPSLGFANPKLYAIAASGSYAADFHDVTTGNNLHYQAGVGYDNASGWGSFNGANLYASLTNAGTPSLGNVALKMLLKHTAPFSKGGTGTYHIVVSNNGSSSSAGPVSVAMILPRGLSYNSFSGSGWTFDSSTLTFTQSNALQPGASYPTIVLEVNVAQNAPSTVVPAAILSINGSVAQTVSNPTTTR
jgi:uncharacterized repeat protein (TIGR01451 family)